jgi:hypothetical protein
LSDGASLEVVSEQQEHPEGAVAAQEPAKPAAESQAPVAEPTDAAQEPQSVEATTPEPEATEAPVAAQEAHSPDPPVEAEAPATPEAEADEAPAPPEAEQPAEAEAPAAPEARERSTPVSPDAVGPKILGVAKEQKLPVVKKRLQEKPKREPLPWPELRAAVAATRDQLEISELKELFRGFPEKLREEVTENVRGFQKGARRPVSQHAAKQLARAAHTARRMKKNSHPSGEVAEALGQAMAAEMIASLEPEKAAQVILPKRDLLDRENRQAQRRQRDEQDKRRDEERRAKREDARSSRQQTSFGEFSGAKIKGLDELAALFPSAEPVAEEPAPEVVDEVAIPAAEPDSPVTPATTTVEPEPPAADADDPQRSISPEPEAQVEGESAPEAPADEATETGSAPQPDDDGTAAA